MLAYGSGLRIGEITNLRVEGKRSTKYRIVDCLRIFVRKGKENKERYTIFSLC